MALNKILEKKEDTNEYNKWKSESIKIKKNISENDSDMINDLQLVIDYNEEEDIASDKQLQDKLFDYMYEILGSDGEGNKTLLTPQVFSVINGEFYGSQICFDDYELDPEPSSVQIERFKDSYRKIMKPFAK